MNTNKNINKHEKLNVIWIVTDSARNFSTGGLDDRDRPEFFDTLKNSFVNFENTVTSAPSSVMSGSCMLTGMNSYYIGRNYDDFRYEEGTFPNLASILRIQRVFLLQEKCEKKLHLLLDMLKKIIGQKNLVILRECGQTKQLMKY